MRFSFGDTTTKGLRSQSGQGVTEYVLVLFVTVAIILGGIYQLNDAFRSWAENYFGNYISCLLETGELPAIGGTPGDSGLCNQLFEPFSLGKGRKLKMAAGPASGSGAQGSSRGTNENGGSGGGNAYAGGGRNGRGGWASSGGRPTMQKIANGGKNQNKENATKTGSTSISSSGGGYRTKAGSQERQQKILDNDFNTADQDDDKAKRRKVSSSSGGGGLDSSRKVRIPIRMRPPTKAVLEEDSPMTFSNFIRILLIAAIVIALVLFVGGQMLQMGKSSE